jgi:mannose-6-phosphate isomerase-like protein (cupin superfamily)
MEPGTPYQRLFAAGQTAGLKSGLVTLSPGASVGEHSTDAKEEIIVFLEGTRVRVTHGEQGSFEVSKNTVVYMPAFTRHNVHNVGTERALYVYVTAPIAQEGR